MIRKKSQYSVTVQNLRTEWKVPMQVVFQDGKRKLGHEWIAAGCFFGSGYICQWYKSWQRIQCYAIMNDLDSLKNKE